MKKILLLLITVLILSFSLVSCGGEKKKEEVPDREYVETEVIAAAKDLIKKTEDLNEIFWGEGLKYSTDIAPNGNYYVVDTFALLEYGIKSFDDIKKLTRDTFSKEYSNYIFSSSVFSPTYDSKGNIIYLARYSQITDGGESDILIHSKWEKLLFDSVEYHYDTVKVYDVEGNTVKVSIDCTVTDSESDKVGKKTITVGLVEEENGWRLNSPTYLNYSE